jgi:hypothetical protein
VFGSFLNRLERRKNNMNRQQWQQVVSSSTSVTAPNGVEWVRIADSKHFITISTFESLPENELAEKCFTLFV